MRRWSRALPDELAIHVFRLRNGRIEQPPGSRTATVAIANCPGRPAEQRRRQPGRQADQHGIEVALQNETGEKESGETAQAHGEGERGGHPLRGPSRLPGTAADRWRACHSHEGQAGCAMPMAKVRCAAAKTCRLKPPPPAVSWAARQAARPAPRGHRHGHEGRCLATRSGIEKAPEARRERRQRRAALQQGNGLGQVGADGQATRMAVDNDQKPPMARPTSARPRRR